MILYLQMKRRSEQVSGIRELAQDKGGPSKGGLLNNRLLSYTDRYLRNEIHGMCV